MALGGLYHSKKARFFCAFFIILGTIFIMKFGFPPYYKTDHVVEILKLQSDFEQTDLTINQQPLHFAQSGNRNKPTILFIHGSPGSWDAWADYLADEDLRAKAHIITVDRPGYNGSDHGMYEPSLQKQAALIMQGAIQITNTTQPIIVIGHSYGGPVALRMAVDYPEGVSALIMLAPSINPALEELRWYNKLADNNFIKKLLPKNVRTSNDEILPLKHQLEIMKKKLDTVKIPVTVIQGEKDKLVPAGNAVYAKNNLLNAKTDINLLPNRGHFIPWEEYDLVKSKIISHLPQ